MANYEEPDEGMEAAYLEWCATRPEHVRKVAERFRPWKLYRYRGGNRCIPMAFGEEENGTVTMRVLIPARFNLIAFERQVFGIKPDDLVECELPAADELTGCMMTPEEVTENMDALRAMMRAWKAQEN